MNAVKSGTRLIVFACIATCICGCESLKGSSWDYRSQSESTVTVPRPVAEAERFVLTAMKERGYPVIGRESGPDSLRLKFKGDRASHTDVAGSVGGSDGYTYGSTHGTTVGIGSVFFVDLAETGGTETQVTFFGKATVNQKEICSEEAPQGIDCQDHLVGAFWPGKPRVSGRVEADVISGIMIELEIWAGIN